MTKQRSISTPEFKREAAKLILYQSYSHIDATQSLGVVVSALRRWVNKLQQEQGGITLTGKVQRPEELKSRELESRTNRRERRK